MSEEQQAQGLIPWRVISVEMSVQIGELAAALAKAQLSLQAAHKTSTNPFFNSKYADLATVVDACREPLNREGLAFVQLTRPDHEKAIIVTYLLHSSGQWLRSELAIKPVKGDPQSFGSALTYARRYALQSIVGVAPEDDDGNAASSGGNTPSEDSTPTDDVPKNQEPPTQSELDLIKLQILELVRKKSAETGASENEILKVASTYKSQKSDEVKVALKNAKALAETKSEKVLNLVLKNLQI